MKDNPLDLRDWEYYGKELAALSKAFPNVMSDFLKEKAKDLSKLQKKIAKQKVKSRGIRKIKKLKQNGDEATKAINYHNSFKVGKLRHNLKYGMIIRAYNNAYHGHLIEQGFKTASGKFVMGKNVLATAANEFRPQFEQELTALQERLIAIGSPEYERELKKTTR